MKTYSIGFIGFGHMAQMMFRSLDRAKLIPRSQILFTRRDTHKIRQNEQEFGITSTTLETLVSKSDVLFICVRPSQAKEILEALARADVSGKKILTILAGVKFTFYERFLGPIPLIRAMPNLPIEIGEGMTILSHGSQADPEFRSFANLFFQSMGEVVELPEEMMDLTTGMAGSAPAYIFALIESVARLGEKEGIPYDKSLKIAAQTFLGSAHVLLKSRDSVEELIYRIAVPNGTTEAGLKVMKALEVEKHFQEVILAVANRSKEISKEIS